MMPALQIVTRAHVARARRLLRQGWDLWAIAEHLKVSRADLDEALWLCMGDRL